MPSNTAASVWLPRDSEYERIALDALVSEPLRQAVELWHSLRGDRPYPARSELTPRRLAKLLSYMSLLKVIDGGADFEHRIVGDIMVQGFRVPVQNRRFSEIARDAPQFIAGCYPLFHEAAITGKPLAWHSHTGHDNTSVVYTHAEIVLLPLGNDFVDHVVAFGVHSSRVTP